jgi:S1-C subfamily serine protease
MKDESTAGELWERACACVLAFSFLLHPSFLIVRAAGPPAPVGVYARTLRCTAWVRAGDGAVGTGWVLRVSGKPRLVTACHVVGGADAVEAVFCPGVFDRAKLLAILPRLRREGFVVRGKVVRRDERRDLALIELEKLPAGIGGLAVAGRAAAVGERLHLVGCRHDVPSLWAHGGGEARGTRRLKDGYAAAGKTYGKGALLLQTAVPINQGDSGGPLVNAACEVVGVAAAVAPEAGDGGLFVSLEELAAFLSSPRPLIPHPPSLVLSGMRATVLIQSPGRPAFAGVVIDRKRGLIVTTAEAVAKEKAVPVTFWREGVTERAWYLGNAALLRKKGLLVNGTVAARDEKSGLVLLSVPSMPEGVEEMVIGGRPEVGEALHLMSHPARMETHWLYAAASLRQGSSEGLIIQAPCLRGEGGGPVFDAAGRLVGVLSGRVGPQAQAVYVVPASEIRRLKKPEGIAWAERLLEAREWGRARKAFAALPASPASLAWVARTWREQGHIDRALAFAHRAVSIKGEHAGALCERAFCWLERGEMRQAVADATRALALEPKNALAFALRSLASARLGQKEKAREDAEEATWHGPRLALAWLARGDPARALTVDGRLGLAYRMRADQHWERADRAAALADYERALAERPWDARALWGRGKARHDGIADLEAAVVRLPGEAELWLDLATARMKREHWRRAGEALARAALLGRVIGAMERIERVGDDVSDGDAAAAMALRLLRSLPEARPLATRLKDGAKWAELRRVAVALRARLEEH